MNARHTWKLPEAVNTLNQPLVTFLFEQAKQFTEDDGGGKYLHLGLTYYTACKSAAKYPPSIRNGQDALKLHGVGPRVSLYIERFLQKSFKEGSLAPGLYCPATTTDVVVTDSPLATNAETSKKSPKKKSVASKSRKRKKNVNVNAVSSPPRRRQKVSNGYRPREESGGYAILIALTMSEESGVMSLAKQDLKLAAQPYCSSSFEVSVDNYYSAWSSMKTIEKKGLVMRAHNPPQFFLTPKGRELGKELLSELRGDGEAMTLQPARVSREVEVTMTSPCVAPEVPDSLIVSSRDAVARPPIPKATPRSAEKRREVSGPGGWNTAFASPVYDPTRGVRTLVVSSANAPPTQWDVVMLLDSREKYRKNSARSELSKTLQRIGVNHETCALNLGDMMWIARDRFAQRADIVLNLIVERKTWQDLVRSIVDNRYYEQRARLMHCPLTRVVIIVEGNPQEVDTIDVDTCDAVMAKFSALFGFLVVRTQNAHHTAKILKRFHREMVDICLQNGVPQPSVKRNVYTFEDFQKKMRKVGNDTMRVFFGKCLRQIKGVSADTAWEILKLYPSMKSLIDAYDACESEEGEIKLLANLKPPLHSKRLGIACSRRIRNLFRARSYEHCDN